MVRKSLGHTHLLWICPNCETRNLGKQKTCSTCGNPQPPDVEFIQGDKEDLIHLKSDEKKSADIHCPYCGTRNSGDAKICIQCGGKLSGGKKRKSGRVIGSFKGNKIKGIKCPSCGFDNEPNAPRCSQCGNALRKNKPTQKEKESTHGTGSIWLVVGLVIIVIVGFLIFKGCSRSTETGRVTQTSWKRMVAVEQFIPVSREDWWDEIPAEAFVTICEERYRYTSDEMVDGAIEMCGTPYTVDQGTGLGEVVADCQYEVYDAYCEYEVSDWEVVEIIETNGFGQSVDWPAVTSYSDQRPGERSEEYTIWFETDNGEVGFTTDDYDLYLNAVTGSNWELTYDGFGNILSAQP